MKRALLALAIAHAGCDKVLGLDRNTLLTDGPLGTCEGPSPACDISVGGTICGRLLGAGAMAGVPFEVAEPTGEVCAAGVTDGPCAYTVGGMPMSSFFGGQTNQAMGFIDDCGRYAVPTLIEPDVAVILTGPDNVNTAAIARTRTIEAGMFTALDVVAVGDTAKALWITQVPGATAFDSGYLVRYSTGTAPRAGEQTTLSGSNPLPTAPSTSQSWVSYFADDGGFGSLDPASTMTTAAGTAYVAPIAIPQPFILEGFRVGRRCMIDGVQTVPQRLIFVEPTDC